MPINTISELTDDQLARLMYAKRMRSGNSETLEDDTKYAVLLVQLHPSVVPGDYPTLKADLEVVTGIQNVSLLFDYETRAAVDLPEAEDPVNNDTKTRLSLMADLTFVDVPKP